jgi:hypothetical protein
VEFAFDEFGPGGDHRAVAMAKVVVDNDLMALIEQVLSDGATDVAGPASNEYSQDFISSYRSACNRTVGGQSGEWKQRDR